MPLLRQCCTGFSKFFLAANLHLSSLEKLYEGSVSKADSLHVSLYQCSSQASISHTHPEAARSWRFLCSSLLAPSQYRLLTQQFYCKIADFSLSLLSLSLFVLHSTFSFHHTTIKTHIHTRVHTFHSQSLHTVAEALRKGSLEVTHAPWLQSELENLNKKKLLSLQKCP